MSLELSRRSLLGGLASIALIAIGAPAFGQRFAKSNLTIVTKSGRHDFDVEMAVTPAQHARGLMFRRSLAPNAGMLFDYRIPQPVSMWMKNTFIPLDMIFIGADGTVVNIAERTVPHSEATVSSQGNVRGVLEVNAGTAARLGIRPGDQIIHPLFGNK